MSISSEDKNRIIDYIEEKQTATRFSNLDDKRNIHSDVVTSELIYYWMIEYQIPHEYEKWHLSRLLTLIEICNRKNSTPKKMSQAEIMARNKALNAERKARIQSRGKVMIKIRQKGDFKKLTSFLERAKEGLDIGVLDKYGRKGVAALSSATPVDTGLTASSWFYKIENKNGVAKIEFHNSNIQNGVPIAVILQYGHGTRNGGYVVGRDYINPAIQPVFDELAENAWKEVTR